MLDVQTIVGYAEIKPTVLVKQCLLNDSIETFIKPNSKASMNANYEFQTKSKKSRDIRVNKTYEMQHGILSESYFDITDKNESIEFMNDYISNSNNGLILVISDETDINELFALSGIEQSIKLIVNCSNCNKLENRSLNHVQQIKVNTISSAVNEAYKHVENGQSILIPYVNSNFDLFEHIESI